MRTKLMMAAAAALAASAAHAGSRDVHYGPPPGWIQARPPEPTTASAPEGAPARILFTDNQTRLGPAGDESYTAYRLKILTPEGLALGNLTATWNPSTDDLTIHRLRIFRDGREIDVLAGSKFQVIQRENRLESAMLDGQLTAALQAPGLEIGDELEFAATLRRRETIFGDRSHGIGQLPTVGGPGAHRVRIVWADGKAVRWQGTPDLAGLKLEDRNGQHELRYEMRAPSSAIETERAPPRFNVRRVIEYTQFSSWAELSALMAPIFDAASQLAAGSPIRAEAARIARENATPEARARAALQLVEDRIRYVYVGLDGGNYQPAAADETWKRRFGDCKAKTVLLMALLRELGVPSEAVLVNSLGGDGMDQRLPTPQMFDHVLVRATIGGKTYWLDGTRLGDRRLSPEPQNPSRWALPLRRPGAGLEAVAQPSPVLPQQSELIDIDARAGLGVPAKVFVEQVTRGDAAFGLRSSLAAMSGQDADRALKAYWREQESWISRPPCRGATTSCRPPWS